MMHVWWYYLPQQWLRARLLTGEPVAGKVDRRQLAKRSHFGRYRAWDVCDVRAESCGNSNSRPPNREFQAHTHVTHGPLRKYTAVGSPHRWSVAKYTQSSWIAAQTVTVNAR